MAGPYAVRVRTPDGWQDIALIGPPGSQGVPGPQGAVGPAGPPIPKRTGFTWALMGTLAAGNILPFFVPVAAGQITKLIGWRAVTQAGSVAVTVTRNGTGIAPTAVNVGTSKGSLNFTTPVTVADGDEIGLTLASPSGVSGLSLTVILEHST